LKLLRDAVIYWKKRPKNTGGQGELEGGRVWKGSLSGNSKFHEKRKRFLIKKGGGKETSGNGSKKKKKKGKGRTFLGTNYWGGGGGGGGDQGLKTN